jgi:hypothetical protein
MTVAKKAAGKISLFGRNDIQLIARRIFTTKYTKGIRIALISNSFENRKYERNSELSRHSRMFLAGSQVIRTGPATNIFAGGRLWE